MNRSVGYYLSKGLDEKTAEYFASGRKYVSKVVPMEDYKLKLTFSNGETRLYDMRPLLQEGSVFEPLRRWEDFRRVYIDENHCVSWDVDPDIDSDKVWSNKIDLSADSCYLDSVSIPC